MKQATSTVNTPLYAATCDEARSMALALAQRALQETGSGEEALVRLAAIEFATLAAANHYWEERGTPAWAARH